MPKLQWKDNLVRRWFCLIISLVKFSMWRWSTRGETKVLVVRKATNSKRWIHAGRLPIFQGRMLTTFQGLPRHVKLRWLPRRRQKSFANVYQLTGITSPSRTHICIQVVCFLFFFPFPFINLYKKNVKDRFYYLWQFKKIHIAFFFKERQKFWLPSQFQSVRAPESQRKFTENQSI